MWVTVVPCCDGQILIDNLIYGIGHIYYKHHLLMFCFPICLVTHYFDFMLHLAK